MSLWRHYSDVIMSTMTSQVTSTTIVYSIVYSVADQGNHQGSASLAFVRGIHRWPVNSPHKWSVTRKMFPFDDVIMVSSNLVPPNNCNLSEVRYTEMNTDLQRKLSDLTRAVPAGGVGGGTRVIVQTKADRRHAPSKEVTWDCYWL